MTPTEALLRYVCGDGEQGPSPEVVRAAERLELEGALYAALRRGGDSDGVAPEALARLRTCHAENAAHSLELLRSYAELRGALAPRGVEVRALKGVALLEHGLNPGARYCLDLDVLAREADRPAVHEVMLGLGYATAGTGGAPKHLPEYRRGTIAVEVHEVAFWGRHRRFGLDELQAEPQPLAFALVHLLHHCFVSSITTPELAAKTIVDTATVLTLASDAPGVEERARALSCEVELTEQLFGIVAAARSLAAGDALGPSARRVVALSEPAVEAELLLRELAFYARAALTSPAWYRRALLESVLLGPDPATRRSGARGALDVAARAVRLTARSISRLSRALIRG
jgi:hypothetical protein